MPSIALSISESVHYKSRLISDWIDDKCLIHVRSFISIDENWCDRKLILIVDQALEINGQVISGLQASLDRYFKENKADLLNDQDISLIKSYQDDVNYPTLKGGAFKG